MRRDCWMLSRNGQTGGPFPDYVIVSWIQQGQVTDGWICRPGGSWWMTIWEHAPFRQSLVPLDENFPGGIETESLQMLADQELKAFGLWRVAKPAKIAEATAFVGPFARNESGLVIVDCCMPQPPIGMVITSRRVVGMFVDRDRFEIPLTEIRTVTVERPPTSGNFEIQLNKKHRVPVSREGNAKRLAAFFLQGVPGTTAEAPRQSDLIDEIYAADATTQHGVTVQLKALGWADSWLTRAEVQQLPKILRRGERIRSITSGFMRGVASELNHVWVIVLTNERILLLDKKLLGGLSQQEIALDGVRAIEHDTGWLKGRLAIHTSGATMSFENCEATSIVKFVKAASELLHERRLQAAAPPQTPANSPAPSLPPVSIAEELGKLAALRDQGVLSDVEFAAAKARIIGGK